MYSRITKLYWHLNIIMLSQLDHQDSGFGKCEIINKCTSEKNNTRAGYKLYAGKYTIN